MSLICSGSGEGAPEIPKLGSAIRSDDCIAQDRGYKTAAIGRDKSGVNTFSSCDDAEAVVVVLGHIVDQIDFPSQIFAHRVLAILPALARREEHIIGLISHPG